MPLRAISPIERKSNVRAKCSARQHRYSSRIKRDNARKIIFIEENIVVCQFACAEQPCVAIKIVVELYRADNIRIYDRPWEAVIVLVAISMRNREEDHFVVFANNNESNCWIKIKFVTCICRLVGGGEDAKVRGMIRNAITARNVGDERTSDVAELFVNNRLEFTIGDAILKETYVKLGRYGQEAQND